MIKIATRLRSLFLFLILLTTSPVLLAQVVSPIAPVWKWGEMGNTNADASNHYYDSFGEIRDVIIEKAMSSPPGQSGYLSVKSEPRVNFEYPPGSPYKWHCAQCNIYTHSYSNPPDAGIHTMGWVAFEWHNEPWHQYEYYVFSSRLVNNAPICPMGYARLYNNNLPYAERYRCERQQTSTQIPDKNPKQCPIEGLIGNPINLSLKAKVHSEIDYQSASSNLKFVRQYVSSGLNRRSAGIGASWWHNYDRRIILAENSSSQTVHAHRPDGRTLLFTLQSSTWKTDSDINDSLIQLFDTQNNPSGWEYFNANSNEKEEYDLSGKLVKVTEKSGQLQTLTYSDSNTPASIAPTSGLLIEVTDNFGRSLQFTYNPDWTIKTMIDPDSNTYQYTYNTPGYLISVTYPGNTTRLYHYENINSASCNTTLTGITDELGIRYATYAYDSECRVIGTEHVGGVDHYSVTYGTNTATVVDPLNTSRTYNFTNILGITKNTGVSQPCTGCGGNASQSRTYDTNGNVSQKTDFNGNITQYQYNSRNLEISRTEAYGTPDAHTVTTTWHATLTLPVEITEPGKTTTFTYDSTGNLLTRTETDTTVMPNVSRTTTSTYNSTGQILTIDGPRTDVNDITTFTYDSMGNRATVTNALSQVTQIPDYDANGNPLTIIDPNGVTTELTYDVRQRLTGRTVAAGTADEATTTFTYDAVGQLTRITKPDGSYLDYEHDDAHRLVAIEDNLGNRIEYTLDAAGNHTAENIYDPGSVLRKTRTAVYDQLGRLAQSIGAGTQTIIYGYDDNGNRTSVTDGNSNTTTQDFDALNRLTQMIDPYNGVTNPTSYAYDAQDNLTSVSDPTGLTTTYQYNGFGEVTQETSPNTGTTTYTYDSAGNRAGKTDARGVTVTYSYDALNRLTGIDYPGTDEDIGYTYDQTLNNNPGIGRLTLIQDQSGSTGYLYDRRGNIIQADQSVVVNGQNIPLSTGYQYDPADNLVQVTYPSGRVVDYNRNSLGQIDQVSATYNMQPQTLASAIGYLPFGSVTSITYGNGLTRTLAHDQDYRITDIVTPGMQDLNFSYDLNNNITQLLNALVTSSDQSFGYDALDRLSTATGAYGSQVYSYDGIGNRLSLTVDANTTNYSYFTNTHRLQSVGSQTRTYDNAGNTTQIDSDTYSYNNQNRLSQATVNGQTVDYIYNSLGQMTIRQTAADTTISFFDQNGLLIGEYDGTGSLIREYVYLNGEPLALADTTASYYYLNNHLGTPQILMDQNQQVVWQAAYDPFGDVNIITSLIENNLRFPGQYFDAGTGFNYNWFRYYDLSTGRYITSDPIGLIGGLNSYIYVGGNSITRTDPTGWIWWNAAPPTTVPVTGHTYARLECVESCLGASGDWNGQGLLCTGGQESEPDENGRLPHSRNSHHYTNSAVDIAGPNFNNYDISGVLQCAAQCGFGAGHYEDFPGTSRDHWHLQNEPGNGVPSLPWFGRGIMYSH